MICNQITFTVIIQNGRVCRTSQRHRRRIQGNVHLVLATGIRSGINYDPLFLFSIYWLARLFLIMGVRGSSDDEITEIAC